MEVGDRTEGPACHENDGLLRRIPECFAEAVRRKRIVRRISELVGYAGGYLGVHDGCGPETSENNDHRTWSGERSESVTRIPFSVRMLWRDLLLEVMNI